MLLKRDAAPPTIRVWGRLFGLEHLHVTDIVYVELRLQHHYQPFPVQPHRQYCCSERHFAYRGMPLIHVSAGRPSWASVYHTFVFCIRSTRGDSVRATKEVEKSISRLDTSPSRDSDCLLNGSVV
jgi:hypothetical protein